MDTGSCQGAVKVQLLEVMGRIKVVPRFLVEVWTAGAPAARFSSAASASFGTLASEVCPRKEVACKALTDIACKSAIKMC